MAPTKRAGVAVASTANKKARDSVVQKCKVVRAGVLSMANHERSPYIEMITNDLTLSLGVAKNERDPFQERVVGWLGEALDDVTAPLQAKVEAAEAALAERSAAQELCIAALERKVADVAAKTEATATAKTALAESKAACTSARETLTALETEEREFDANPATKTRLEECLNNDYTPLKNGAAENVQAHIESVVKIGKIAGFEPSLLYSIPSSFAKAPDTRGAFDVMCVEQVGAEITKKIAALTSVIEAAELAKAERSAKLDAANESSLAAETAEESCNAAYCEAKSTQKEAEAALRRDKTSVKQSESDVKKAASQQAVAREKFAAMMAGAVADFNTLKEREGERGLRVSRPAPPEGTDEEAVVEEDGAVADEADEEEEAVEEENDAENEDGEEEEQVDEESDVE